MLPDPVIMVHDGFNIVRDDLLPGGTKRRAIHVLFDDREEYVYASPVYGYAQLALAYAARDHGKRATIFCAKRNTRHRLTLQAEQVGATIHEIPNGYLSVVKARAVEYCLQTGARLLPFGLDSEAFLKALADVASKLPQPNEVWTVAGSGVLTRALQIAWPEAVFYAVQIGAVPKAGNATLFVAPEAYEKDAKQPPPFPSCSNYDAKAWQYMKRYASKGACFWNVGA